MQIEREKDIRHIQRSFEKQGYAVTKKQAEEIWKQVSAKNQKDWLTVPKGKVDRLYKKIVTESELATGIERKKIIENLDKYLRDEKMDEAKAVIEQFKKII